MREMAIAVTAICLLVLAGCAGARLQDQKPDGRPSKLSMRIARHPEHLRIVFEGPAESVKKAVVETPDEETVTVRFAESVVISHEPKGIVVPEKPFEAFAGVAMVLRDTTCTLIVLNLREVKVTTLQTPSRLVIDAYVTAATQERIAEPPGAAENTFRKGSEPDGFRGISWGTGIKKLPGLAHVRSDPSFGGVDLYARKGDALRVGAARLDSIEYGFWQGKLSHVILKSTGLANWLSLRDATLARFGAGFRPSEYSETYWWFGEATVAKLDYHQVPQVGFLYLYSKQIMKEQEDYTSRKAAEGARKGF